MQKFYHILFIGFLLFQFTSCVEEDDFVIAPNPVQNIGEVYFDGATIPITYADLVFIDILNNGSELWALTLSENFIARNDNATETDVLMYLEFVRPPGSSLAANYFIHDPIRPILFIAYFEDVIVQNGTVVDYSFEVEDNEITNGKLAVRLLPEDSYHFDVEMDTSNGLFIDAFFEGLLRF